MILRIHAWLVWIAVLGVVVVVASATEVQTNGQAETNSDQNAATYYSRAFDVILYPTSPEQKEAIQTVIKNGWSSANQELADVVDRNKMFFEAFQKGLSLKQCDFSFGRDPLHETLPNVVKTRDATYLALLRGRYLEHLGDINNAVEGYLGLLTFAQHIGQTKRFVALMLVEALEERVVVTLNEYVSSTTATAPMCRRISEALKRHEEARPSPSFIREIEAEEKAYQEVETLGVSFDEATFSKGENKYGTSLTRLRQLRALADSKAKSGT